MTHKTSPYPQQNVKKKSRPNYMANQQPKLLGTQPTPRQSHTSTHFPSTSATDTSSLQSKQKHLLTPLLDNVGTYQD